MCVCVYSLINLKYKNLTKLTLIEKRKKNCNFILLIGSNFTIMMGNLESGQLQFFKKKKEMDIID